jgi:hypothetical protein
MKGSLTTLAVIVSLSPTEAFLPSAQIAFPRATLTTLLHAGTDPQRINDSNPTNLSNEEPDLTFFCAEFSSLDLSKTSPLKKNYLDQSIPNRSLRKQPFQVVLGAVDDEPTTGVNSNKQPKLTVKKAFPVHFDHDAFPDQGSRMSTAGRGAAPAANERTSIQSGASPISTHSFFIETYEQAEERRRQQDDFWKTPLTTQEAAYYRGLEVQQRQLEALQRKQLEADLREEARLEALVLAARRGEEVARRNALVGAQQLEEEERDRQERTYGAVELFRSSKQREVPVDGGLVRARRKQELAYQRQANVLQAAARAAAKLEDEERQTIEIAKKRGEEFIRLREKAAKKNSINEEAQRKIELVKLAYQRQVELEKARAELESFEEEASRRLLEQAERRGTEAYEKKMKQKHQQALLTSDSVLELALRRGKSYAERQRELEEEQRRDDERMKELQELRIARARERGSSYSKHDQVQASSLQDTLLDAAFRRGALEAERNAQIAADRKAEEARLRELQAKRIAEAEQRGLEVTKYKERLNHGSESLIEAARQRGLAHEERKARLEKQRIEQQVVEELRQQQFLADAQERGRRMAQIKEAEEEARRSDAEIQKQILVEAQLRGLELERQRAAAAKKKEEEQALLELEGLKRMAAESRALGYKKRKFENSNYGAEQKLAEAELRGLALQRKRLDFEIKMRQIKEGHKEDELRRLKEAELRGIEDMKYKEQMTAQQADQSQRDRVMAEAEYRGMELQKKMAETKAKMEAMERELREDEFRSLKEAELRGIEDMKYKEEQMAQLRAEEDLRDMVLVEAELRGLELEKKKAEAKAKMEAMERELREDELRRLKEAELRGIEDMKYKEEQMAQLRAEEDHRDMVLVEAELRGLELEKKKAEAKAKMEVMERELREDELRRLKEAELRGIEDMKYKEEQMAQLRAEEDLRDMVLVEAELRGLELEKKKAEAKAKMEAMERELREDELRRLKEAELRGITALKYREAKVAELQASEPRPHEVLSEAQQRGLDLEKNRAAAEAVRNEQEQELEQALKKSQLTAERRGLEAIKYRSHAEEKALDAIKAKEQILDAALRRGEKSFLQRLQLEAEAAEQNARLEKAKEFRMELAEKRGELSELMKSEHKRKKMAEIQTKVSMLDEAIKRGEVAARHRAAEAAAKQQEALEREEATKRLIADAEKRGQVAAALRAKERAMHEEHLQTKNKVLEEARRRGALASKMKAEDDAKRRDDDRRSAKARNDALRQATQRGLRAVGKDTGGTSSLTPVFLDGGSSLVPFPGLVPKERSTNGIKHFPLSPSTTKATSDVTTMKMVHHESISETQVQIQLLSFKIEELNGRLKELTLPKKVAAASARKGHTGADVVTPP